MKPSPASFLPRPLVITLIVWFVVANLFAIVAVNRVDLRGDSAYSWIVQSGAVQQQTWNPVRLHAKWDSFWHMSVADTGYRYQSGQEQNSNIVFFPLYPLALRMLTPIIGDFILSGWIISTIFLVLATGYLYRLISEVHPNIEPLRAVWFLLIFPTPFFLNAVYTESMFLFLSLAVLVHTIRRQYWMAGLFGLMAALTRPIGVLLIVPLAWEAFQWARRGQWQWRSLIPILTIPIGIGAFFGYHWWRFGDPLLFFRVESAWGRSFQFNQEHFQSLTRAMGTNLWLDIAMFGGGVVCAWLCYKRLRPSYGLYMGISLIMIFASGTLMSIGRYMLVMFPIPILFASIQKRDYQVALMFVSGLFFALYTLLFVNNYWAG